MSVLSNMIAISDMWVLATGNVSSATEELNFKFYLILINLNSHMWLLATVLDSAELKDAALAG